MEQAFESRMDAAADPDMTDASTHFIILHDAVGQIVHIHRHTTFSQVIRSDTEIEAHARDLVYRIKPTVPHNLQALHLKTIPVVPRGARLVVDTAKGLVRIVSSVN